MSCIIAWRIQWVTLLNRYGNRQNPRLVFSKIELKILSASFAHEKPKHLRDYINLLARLGGYLNRTTDPPPGNCIIWRGFNKLLELQQGYLLAEKCG